MSDARQSTDVALARRIDLACDRFEQNWQLGRRQSLESYLVSVNSTERSAYLRALLELELELRRQQGEVPQRNEYLVRFSGDQTLVESLFESAEKPSPLNAGRPPVESQIDQTKTGQPKKSDGVRREGGETFGLRVDLDSQDVMQTQGLTLRSQLWRPRTSVQTHRPAEMVCGLAGDAVIIVQQRRNV